MPAMLMWRAWYTKCGTALTSHTIDRDARQRAGPDEQRREHEHDEREVQRPDVAHEVLVVRTVHR